MELPIFVLDAFASRPFTGNPAAVCVLPRWLDDAVLQAIAAEQNLSETAFLVQVRAPNRDDALAYALRWFTPTVEVDLCGHATLASAAVVLDALAPGHDAVSFGTKSGPLAVTRVGTGFRMDFPALVPSPCAPPEGLEEALGAWPRSVLRAPGTLVCVLDDADEVRGIAPDFQRVRALPFGAVIVTARARAGGESGTSGEDDHDFVSRVFAPAEGIDEDPVTGSAHCVLAPYWGARLKKPRLRARQLSRRGGALVCERIGERVHLEGTVVPYLRGTLTIAE
jgi:PhzF family phenazine biosynthesis protein